MNKRIILNLWIKGAAVACLALSTLNTFAQQQNSQPNIVVVYTDDWGYSDLGIHGIRDDILTPNIDQLAQSGVLFTDGYVTAPQCAPSRAGFLTCKYQQRFGFDSIPSLPLKAEEKTVANHLKGFGYRTGMIGKWHLDIGALGGEWAKEHYPDALVKRGSRETVDVDAVPANVKKTYEPGQRGFDEYYWGRSNDYIVNFPPHQNTESGVAITVGGDRVDQKTEASLDFIERNANQKKPFFLYTAYYAPHTPSTPSKHYLDQIPAQESQQRRKGLALMLAVDTGVGKIVNKLKELNIYDNTIVLFVSDNGAPLADFIDTPEGKVAYSLVDENHPAYTKGKRLRWDGSHNEPLNGDKGLLTEGGIRVPMVMSWPNKIKSGQTCGKPVNTLDLAKTFLSAAGDVSTLPELDGVNLLPYLNGQDDSDLLQRPMFWRFYTQSAVRKGKWKLLLVSDQMEFLFDLDQDKEEKNNVIEQYPEVAGALRKTLTTWAGKMTPAKLPSGPLQPPEVLKYKLYFSQE
ncbi:Arylsulfatase [Pontiella desulfatans]|uniref:Arylsulfatase n=1 Tax=Pontiella desulfatans TaxID=2750659 RepID=A0A6C2TZ63_PONDE|nr:sulfatase-like hydrolase/transferase [Pontiella desulfatans]SPS73712.1 sulfatase S1_39,S1_7 [Kiritimatiellales bacterium]VGO13008.1 Arylsulfatase [Pontiella desulfatans]